ncbi:MAG: NAD(P)H-quinone oxidoreductase [Granulosicoccus sp.]
MQTIEISEFGPPEVLIQGQRDAPEPRNNEVLVKVLAAGVNGPDLVQRRGHYPPPEGASDLLGLEISGEVIGVGANVNRWKIGDQICALTNGGGYAEFVAVDEQHCLEIPKNVSPGDAAGLPETYFTVWSNCFYQQTYSADDVFLVHGGAGGIGSTAIQLGAALGLNVLTTCSGSEDANFCKTLGATQTIDYRDDDFVGHVKAAGGAALILDIIGGDYIARNIKAAKADARIIQLAFNAGSKVEINLMPIMLKRLTYTGSTLRSRPASFKAAIARDIEEKVWPLFEQGILKTQTHCTLPFKDVVKSHKMMEAGDHRGKILLTTA